jgi:hypothetical protein
MFDAARYGKASEAAPAWVAEMIAINGERRLGGFRFPVKVGGN